MIVDYALYQNGIRYTEPSNLPELIMKAKTEGGFVWLGLAEPTQIEFDKIVGDFRFHPLAIEDAITAKQRPKFEEYPGVQFCVLKTVFTMKRRVWFQLVKSSVSLVNTSS